MTNRELAEKRAQLRAKADRIAGLPAFAAAGDIKTAALLAAEITDELARRELSRAAGGELV
ncbi:hypothetical protein [Billgrantia bachuensis]|uniref:Uncharacterized protein n=1 Tax=Billgrantia bachuensis TaxID=2717286 RepID=A0ABX0PL46_9GAMM|nr:hypothetical protein [Halomonas bachuensis]NIC03982.1 hypothetical protein [Halomonas bachuensis]